MAAVEFGASVSVEDRNPEVLSNASGFGFKGQSFRSDSYVAIAGYKGQTWTWKRSGILLNMNGQPRRDEQRGQVRLAIEDVPDYARRELYEQLAARAGTAKDAIDLWVAAAAEVAS